MYFPFKLKRAGLLLLVPLVLQACGGDTDGGGDGTISISLASSSATIAQGGSTTVLATLTRGGDFTGAVTFSVTGAPTGVTAGVSNPTTSGSTTTGLVTIVVAADAPTGNSTIVVKATGTGVDPATASFTLTVSATTTPSYSISLNPAALSVVQGVPGTSSVTLTRTNGFVGSVNLSLTGAPTGMTATFAPNDITTNTSTATITASTAVSPGVYTVYVGGVASGQGDKVTPLVVTVTSAGTSGYSLSAAATASVAQGNGVSPVITITRTGGFAGSVALSATGVPNGMTASFSPSSTTGNTSTLTLTAGPSMATGTSAIVVHGISGATDQTTTINVTVTSSGGGGNASISFAACAASNKAIWVAFQNGTGAWTPVTGTNDVYSFTINAGKGGIAWVTSGGTDIYTTSVSYYTQAEITNGQITACGAGTSAKTATGTVANVTITDFTLLSLGGANASPTFTVPAFTLTGIASGNQDLVGWRRSFVTPVTTDRGFLRRDVNLASGGSVGTVDLNGGESFAPIAAQLGLFNLNGGTLGASMYLMTGANCSLNLLYTASGGTVGTMLGVPVNLTRATDYYSMSVSETNGTTSKLVQETFKTFANRNVTLGANFTAPTVTSLGGSYKRLQATYTLPADYQSSSTFQYSSPSAPFRSFVMTATFGWFGGPAATLAAPDFSALAGWSNTWAVPSAVVANWTTSVAGITNGGASLCVDGGRTTVASVSGTN